MKNQETKITIGLPAYNGENTIERAIDSLLAQTYNNFELIISDDGSTDSTSQICKEYEKIDKRIKYIQKNEGKGWIKNFIFLVDKTKSEYFMWAAQDDYWDPKFIEKNLEVLESHSNVVGSISNVKLIGKNIEKYYSDENYSNFKFVQSYYGTYEKKIQNVLAFNWIVNIYSIFRTQQLKKSIVRKKFASWDFAIILNIIKFGDLNVLDDILMFKDTGGVTSTNSEIKLMKRQNLGWFKTYFPYVGYTIFCINNLGIRIFLKNISHFKYINFHAGKKIIKELFNKNEK